MSPGADVQVVAVSKPTSHRRGSILYLFLFMAYGCIGPFMPLICRSKGFSEHQVGLVGAIRPISLFFVTPVLCAFADRHGIQQQMLYAALGLFVLFRPSVLLAGGFWAVGAVEALCAVSNSPVGSLVDSAVRHSFGADGYGIQRLWGAVGFGVASLISGVLCDAAGGSYEGVMIFFMSVMIVALVASTGVSVGQHAEKLQDDEEGGPRERLTTGDNDAVARKKELVEIKRAGDGDAPSAVVVPTAATASVECSVSDQVKVVVTSGPVSTFGQELHDTNKGETYEEGKVGVLAIVRVMLATSHNATFFAAVGLSGMGAGIIDMFLFIRLEELGGSHLLCGLARLIMCLAEVPFFYLSGPLIRRMGVRGVIALTQLAYLTRFIYYSALREPWWVLPAEVLHGLTFAAMWAATTDYAHDIAPAHMRTTIQGAVTGLHWGLGFGLGAMLGGVLYAGLGASLCFRVSAVLPSLSLLLLAMPTAWSWLSNSIGRCGVWAAALLQCRRRGESAYELVHKESDNTATEGFGRDDEERGGETDPSVVLHVGKEHMAVL